MTGLGCLLFPRGGWLLCWLCTRLSGGGAGLLQQVLPQGLLPLSWGCGREPRHAGSGPKHLHMSLLGRRVLGNLPLSYTFWAPTESASGCPDRRPQPGALGAWCSPCGAESGRPRIRWRSPAVALPFPLTELSLLKPLAVCNPPPPKPSPTTPGTYVQRQGRIGAEARKAPVATPRLLLPAPSWRGSLKARQVWARLAPGRAASRQELCQIGALSRARALPYWRRT